jgi:S1-C subfamily serine protease
VRRGYLGVSLQPVRLPKEIAADLAQQTAVLIVSVEPGSPAEAGGLHLGDTITAMDGRPVKQLDDLMVFLAAAGVGTAVELTVLRGGDLRSQKVTLGEREAVK